MRCAHPRVALWPNGQLSVGKSRLLSIARSDSMSGSPLRTVLLPAHLRGGSWGNGLSGRQERPEWAEGASTARGRRVFDKAFWRPKTTPDEFTLGHAPTGGAQCAPCLLRARSTAPLEKHRWSSGVAARAEGRVRGARGMRSIAESDELSCHPPGSRGLWILDLITLHFLHRILPFSLQPCVGWWICDSDSPPLSLRA